MEKDNGKIIKNIITWIMLLICLFFAYRFYKKNNFNEYTRIEQDLHLSQFKRDDKVKYSKTDSYKVISNTDNDAGFYKTVKVEKNKPYKVTCMVKTENVIPEQDITGIGAQISIVGSTERSEAISGTNDWKKIEMLFNSKDREEVNIGFRLGGYLGNCTGTAWFSDFTLEEGVSNSDNEWKFACLIFENLDVTVNNKNIKLSMSYNDLEDMKDVISRFQNTCKTMSNGKMTANCDTYQITEPISKLTYDSEFGYYVAPEDIEKIIKSTLENKEYDHIFIMVRLRK